MLIHISGVLTPQEVLQCRHMLEMSRGADGKAAAGGYSAKTNVHSPPASDVTDALGSLILDALARCDTFTSAALPLRIFPPCFNRHDVGMSVGYHIDKSIQPDPETGFRVRTDVCSTVFLSELESYDGGELVIQDTYGVHTVKCPAGDLVLYPATSLQKINPVTRGNRWASFFWTQSMVKDDGCRTLLYELDQSIRQTRQLIPDSSPAVLGLTAAYRNLVRKWAEL